MSDRRQSGFTLLEVMIALFVFGLVLAGMAPAFVMQMRQNTENAVRTGAIAAAQIALDDIRLNDITVLPMSGSAAPVNVNVDGRDYSVVVRYCVTASYCNPTSTRHLTVEVAYRDDTKYRTQTVYTQLR